MARSDRRVRGGCCCSAYLIGRMNFSPTTPHKLQSEEVARASRKLFACLILTKELFCGASITAKARRRLLRDCMRTGGRDDVAGLFASSQRFQEGGRIRLLLVAGTGPQGC